MFTKNKKNQFKVLNFRSRFPCLSSTFFTILILSPIITFLLFISFTCPKDIDVNNDGSIPNWIKSHNKPLTILPKKGDPGYDPIKHATIYVAIAAYRDPECRNTILQVFEHAAYPDRLRIGLFTQNDANVDQDCADFRSVLNCDSNSDYEYLFKNDDINKQNDAKILLKDENDDKLTDDEKKKIKEEKKAARRRNGLNIWKQKYKYSAHVLCGRLWQIRAERVHWRDGLGPTYGRYRAELFYNNEEYYLQMDSHTSFALNWDIILIKMHLELNNDYGVISTYPKPLLNPSLWQWTPKDVNYKSDIYVICKTGILVDKLTKSFKLSPANIIKNPGKPILTAFFAAGFSFQKGHRITNVPYDPYAAFVFDGEEMSMAVRMWTHGYDFYAPYGDVAYHLYSPNDEKIRPVFWESDDWQKKQQWKITRYSEFRLNFIMGLHYKFHNFIPLTSIDLREIDIYGCGDKRDVEQFWNFTRIDLKNLTKLSPDLCPIYKQGGMHPYRIPWKNESEDPYAPIL